MNIIKIISLVLIFSYQAFSQDVKRQNISQSRITDRIVTNNECILFYSYAKNFVDTLYLHQLNPYNYLSFDTNSIRCNFNKSYQIRQNDEFESMFPSDYRHKYFVDSTLESGNQINILHSFIYYSKHPRNFFVVAFSLYSTISESETIDGAISTIFVYDTNRNVIYKKGNIPCVDNEIAISDDGRYIAYRYGTAWPDGILIPSGIQIIDIKYDKIILDEKGYIHGPDDSMNNILNITCDFPNGYSKDYYLNSTINKLYSYLYNRMDMKNEIIEVTAEGVLILYKNKNRVLLTFEKDFQSVLLK